MNYAAIPSPPLEPCPFCNGTEIYPDQVQVDESWDHFLVCRSCGSEGPDSLCFALAVMLWNIRPL